MGGTEAKAYRAKHVKQALTNFSARELPVLRDLAFLHEEPVLFSDLTIEGLSSKAVYQILKKAVKLGLVIRTAKEGSGRPVPALREYFGINQRLRDEIEEYLPSPSSHRSRRHHRA